MREGQRVATATFPTRPGVYVVWEAGHDPPLLGNSTRATAK
jgi:hypothetical protein